MSIWWENLVQFWLKLSILSHNFIFDCHWPVLFKLVVVPCMIFLQLGVISYFAVPKIHPYITWFPVFFSIFKVRFATLNHCRHTSKFWLGLIFLIHFCGSKVLRGVMIRTPTLRSPMRCHDHKPNNLLKGHQMGQPNYVTIHIFLLLLEIWDCQCQGLDPQQFWHSFGCPIKFWAAILTPFSKKNFYGILKLIFGLTFIFSTSGS